MEYLKYWSPVLLVATAYAGIVLGGNWTWLGVGSIPVLTLLDSLAPYDFRIRTMRNRALANIPVWLCTLGPVLLYFVFAWRLSVGHLGGWQTLGGMLSVAWMSTLPFIPATHELFHMRGTLSRWVGRYGMIAILDTMRDISHVVGHHIDVATPEDGDTAVRGASLYSFTMRCLAASVNTSFSMENNALRKRGLPAWHYKHRAYRAVLAIIVFHAIVYAIGGLHANFYCLLTQLIARVWVESFNYFQHYGVIRLKGTPIGRRHLWNHLRYFSRTLGFEITNHADHHINTYQEYYRLVPHQEAIKMPSVFVCFMAALVPPVWQELIAKPALKRWDAEFATDEELVVAQEQNRAAGWPEWQIDHRSQLRRAATIGI